ncbi:MAG TPA: MFS transporter [Polyangiaceae bacterium]
MSAFSSERNGGVSWKAAFQHRRFRLYQGGRMLSVLGTQMQSVAIGWQIYAVTGRPLDLAWVGLAQFMPAVALSLVTGQVADRVDRRRILVACNAAMACLGFALFFLARGDETRIAPIYAVLVGIGVTRAFQGPAGQSLLPSLVPTEHFPNAVAWSSSIWQVATVLGPMLGGFGYAAIGASRVYAVAGCCSVGASLLVAAIDALPRPAASGAARSSVLAGARYVASNPIVLGAISLDLFAVLLGGATALLPVYARDILRLGPWALGALRSAPAAGAAVTGVLLALRPIERRAGRKMLACVAVFGLATIVFGLSRSFVLSLLALVVAGASDMVSVVVRSALVQLATPDAMRGRVSAVNMVFIGASNELGEFESGVTAQWLGTVPSVVLGGIATIVVVAIWATSFPALRRVDRLHDVSVAD